MLVPHNTEIGEGWIKVKTKLSQDFKFLNVDLEIESNKDLTPLLQELEGKADAIYHRGFKDGFDQANLNHSTYPDCDDETKLIGQSNLLIAAFCDLLENLSETTRNLWEDSKVKYFDVGYECGNKSSGYRTEITTETMRRCAELGVSIRMTVYPFPEYEIHRKED